MTKREHWEKVWRTHPPTGVTWYAPHLAESLRLIREVTRPDASVIDVGGGASTLVDDLVAAGYRNITVLDISEAALAVARARLRDSGAPVQWVHADITSVTLPEAAYDVWHDRAVFHFLTGSPDRRAYADLAAGSLKPGGHAIVAAFSLEGPTRCSGLDVVRYSAESLSRELGPAFTLKQEIHESHRTPSGTEQKLIYCLFQRIKSAA